jgi:hypothetical protein
MPGSEGSADGLRADVENRLEFQDVSITAFAARCITLGDVGSAHLRLGGNFSTTEHGHLLLQYTVECSLLDAEADPAWGDTPPEERKLALLNCDFVADYRVVGEAPPSAVMPALIQNRGLRDVFPYIREAVSSMSTRLGFARVGIPGSAVLDHFAQPDTDGDSGD